MTPHHRFIFLGTGTADNEERCQECHQMRLTKGERETGVERGCLKCHGGLVDNPYVHGPVSVAWYGGCANSVLQPLPVPSACVPIRC